MTVWLAPSYLKPKSKIASGIIPMVYVETKRQEMISDLKKAAPVLSEYTEMYKNYELLTLATDLRGNPQGFKVFVFDDSPVLVPIEEFVNKATFGLKEIAKTNGKYNLLSHSGEKLIKDVYEMLDKDLRIQIAVPTQWLVYIPKEKKLTRLCWVVEIGGKIVVRPWGETNILLEVENVKFDAVNSVSIRKLKMHGSIKERLNNSWRTLVLTEKLSESLGTLEEHLQETEETESEEIGGVE